MTGDRGSGNHGPEKETCHARTALPMVPIMKIRALRFSCGTILPGLAATVSLTAKTVPDKSPGLPPAPPAAAAGPAEGLTDEMRAFLKEVHAAYRRAKSYRDHGRAVIVQVSGKVKTTTEVPMSTTFVRPNLLRLDAG